MKGFFRNIYKENQLSCEKQMFRLIWRLTHFFVKKNKLMMKIWRVYSNVHAKSWKCDQYLPE